MRKTKTKFKGFIAVVVFAFAIICACSKENQQKTEAANYKLSKNTSNMESSVATQIPTPQTTLPPTEEPEPTPTDKPLSVKSVKLGDDVTIKVEMGEKECSICKITAKKSCKKIVIPGKIGGKPVTGIEYEYRWQPIEDSTYNIFGKENNNSDVEDGTPEDWYKANNKKIEEIVLPDSIRKIKRNSFAGLTGLKKINLPKNLKKLENETFARCSKLESIDIPKNTLDIKIRAFWLCSGLKRIHVKEGNEKYIEKGDFILERNNGKIIVMSKMKKSVVIPKEAKRFSGSCFSLYVPTCISLSNMNKYLKQEKDCLYEKKSGKLIFAKPNSKGIIKTSNGVKALGPGIVFAGYVNKIIISKNVKYWWGTWCKNMHTKRMYAESPTVVVKGKKMPILKGNKKEALPYSMDMIINKNVAGKFTKLYKKYGYDFYWVSSQKHYYSL